MPRPTSRLVGSGAAIGPAPIDARTRTARRIPAAVCP